MIVDVVNIVGVALLETKDDAPVRPDSHAQKPLKIALQGMQPEAGQVHVFGLSGSIEDGENIFHFSLSDPGGYPWILLVQTAVSAPYA